MKRLLGLALAVLVMAMAVPAFADVDVTVDINKDKDIVVKEFIFKLKVPIAIVVLLERLDGAAEAEAIVNVVNARNYVDAARDKIDLDAVIKGSIEHNTGIVQVNQDVGNMVNQGNVVAVAVTSRKSWTDAQAEVDQKNGGNTVIATGRATSAIADRTATISGSINHNAGIVQVNQNASYMNNQTNAAAVGVGFGAAVALSEAALGQVNAGNVVVEINTLKEDLIEKSITHNRGIVMVNQSTGNMNNQGSAVSVAGLAARARLGD